MPRRLLILGLSIAAILASLPVSTSPGEWVKPAVGKWVGKTSRDTRIAFTVGRKPGTEKRLLPRLRWTAKFYGEPDPFVPGDCPRTYTFIWPAPPGAPYSGDDPIPVRKRKNATSFLFNPWDQSAYRRSDGVSGVFTRKRRAWGRIFMDGGLCWTDVQTMTWRAHRKR